MRSQENHLATAIILCACLALVVTACAGAGNSRTAGEKAGAGDVAKVVERRP